MQKKTGYGPMDRPINRWMDGQTDGRMDGQTDGRMDGKSTHSTGLCPLLGPLPKKPNWSFWMGRARGGQAVTTPWPYPKERARGRLAEMTTWPFPKRGNERKARSDNPGPYAKGRAKKRKW